MNKLKKFFNYLCVCVLVIGITFGITLIVNYALTKKNISFSSKSAQINYVEYSNDSSYVIKISRSLAWHENENYGYIINIDINNISEDVIDNWDVNIDFKDDIKFEEGWEGDYSSDKQTVSFKPLDHSEGIEPAATFSCGFIVSADCEINIEDLVIDFKNATFKLQNN